MDEDIKRDYVLSIDETYETETQVMLEESLPDSSPFDEGRKFVFSLVFNDSTKQNPIAVKIHDELSTGGAPIETAITKPRDKEGMWMFNSLNAAGASIELAVSDNAAICEILFRAMCSLGTAVRTLNHDNLEKDADRKQLLHLVGLQAEKIKGLEGDVAMFYEQILDARTLNSSSK